MSNKAKNERKAQKVLIIMFITFVTAWLPFFFINITSAICSSCNKFITPALMVIINWLGYLASMANPIIYTMFNKKFRMAFHHLLLCQSQTTLTSDRSSRYRGSHQSGIRFMDSLRH